MSQEQSNPFNDFFSEITEKIEDLKNIVNTQTPKIIEQTTKSTGETLDWIAKNPVLRATDKVIGLDWLMTFLGQADFQEIQARVKQMRSQYPQDTPHQIAQRLIMQKTWDGGRLGLLTNIVPPVAALFLGIELIATTKLQTEMVYEIASAYGLDLTQPARRGEVLAIFGLSLGADVLKTGMTIVELIPGIGAVIGASTNAALLYVLGQTACRFYEAKTSQTAVKSLNQATSVDWEIAMAQSQIMDRILTHMVKISYPNQDWSEVLPTIKKISPDSVDIIAENLEQPSDLTELLNQLIPEFAPLTLNRCYEIANSTGEITPKEQEVLSQIAIRFNLDITSIINV